MVGRFELSIEPWPGLKQGWCHSKPLRAKWPDPPPLRGGAPVRGTSHAFPCTRPEAGKAGQEFEMNKLAFMFLAFGLVAAVFGFAGLAGAATPIAEFFAVVFGLLSLGFLLIGRTGSRVTT